MSLKHIGTTACPFCQQLAPVGISLEGEGNSVHLICRVCSAQVQAHRYGRVGELLQEKAAATATDTEGEASPEAEKPDPWAEFWPGQPAR